MKLVLNLPRIASKDWKLLHQIRLVFVN